MFRWWAFWRRVQYTIGFLMLCTLMGVGYYYTSLYKLPTCSDGLANGDERGVDCGGVCERMCSADIIAPQSLWAESFKIIDGQYNVVSYVENRNRIIGSPVLAYTIKLFDAQGLIVERRGETVLPPDGVYPIFEGRVLTGVRVPERTTIEFDEAEWLPGVVGRDQFDLERRDLKNADSKPRLTAVLQNTSVDEARDVEIVATIFNVAGDPLTSARTFIEFFEGRTTKDVVFTWPEPIAKTLRSCEVPTDVMLAIDLSGSMNNDGGTPPEPITSVLSSAQSFVTRLNKNDQIGVVTFATKAMQTQMLTSESTVVAGDIFRLAIDSEEEQGSTNTGDAFKLMTTELTSGRHNGDARKVAILFTDGLTNAPGETPEEYAITAATELKSHGVEVFTIGLGEKLNAEFLKKVATDDAHAFVAPTTRDVDGIYQKITSALCEDGAAIIEIIAKPKTSFKQWQ